jgi:hypothetical protein
VRLRITKIDEYQFLTCLKHGLWGSKSARFKTWRVGDKLAIVVEKNLAGLCEVAGPPYESREQVWENGLFPHRIPVKLTHVLRPKDRPPILGEIRDALTEEWGPNYGWAILNQQILESPHADTVVRAITSKPNALSEYHHALAEQLEAARLKREQAAQRPPRRARPADMPSAEEQLELQDEPVVSKRDATAHTKALSELITLGKIAGCSVWIAADNQGRTIAGRSLAADCLKKLPGMGLSPEAMDRISRIDVIWVSQNAPVYAFEVETTTSIYSGLLRMSDLLAVVPALNIQIYIVAPRERQKKVFAELVRPTFSKIGLSEYCRYIPAEELSGLLGRVKGLGGHIHPTVLDTIAIPLEDEEDEDSP